MVGSLLSDCVRVADGHDTLSRTTVKSLLIIGVGDHTERRGIGSFGRPFNRVSMTMIWYASPTF